MGDPKQYTISITNQKAINTWITTTALPYLIKRLKRDFSGNIVTKRTFDQYRKLCLRAVKANNGRKTTAHCGKFARYFFSGRAAAYWIQHHLQKILSRQVVAKARKVRLKPNQRVIKVTITKLSQSQLNGAYAGIKASFTTFVRGYKKPATSKMALQAVIKMAKAWIASQKSTPRRK